MGFAKIEQVPADWSPNTARIIDKMFEDVYRKLRTLGLEDEDAAATPGSITNGLDTLNPAIGDLIACISSAGQFQLLPIVATVQRVLTNNGGVPSWDVVNLASGVTGKLPWANLADVSATARVLGRKSGGAGVIEELTLSELLDFIGSAAQGDILYRDAAGWARLPAGTNGHFLQTQGAAANPHWTSVTGGAGLPIFTGAGNPQGQTGVTACEQAPGSLYIDTNNGYVYRKLGGGTTAYGWYLDLGFPFLLSSTVRPYILLPPHSSTTLTAALSGAQFLAADNCVNTNANNTAREYAAGQIWNYFDTSNVANANSYFTTTASQLRWWEYDFDFMFRIRTPSDVTSLRLWIGLTTGVITDNNSLAAGAKSAAMFRYSTPSTDGGWVGFAANAAAAGSETVTGTVAAIAADTAYNLRIRLVRAGTPTLYFSVNDGPEQSVTTNIPPTGVTSFITMGVTNKTAGGGTNIRGFRWAGVTGWYGTPA